MMKQLTHFWLYQMLLGTKTCNESLFFDSYLFNCLLKCLSQAFQFSSYHYLLPFIECFNNSTEPRVDAVTLDKLCQFKCTEEIPILNFANHFFVMIVDYLSFFYVDEFQISRRS